MERDWEDAKKPEGPRLQEHERLFFWVLFALHYLICFGFSFLGDLQNQIFLLEKISCAIALARWV